MGEVIEVDFRKRTGRELSDDEIRERSERQKEEIKNSLSEGDRNEFLAMQKKKFLLNLMTVTHTALESYPRTEESMDTWGERYNASENAARDNTLSAILEYLFDTPSTGFWRLKPIDFNTHPIKLAALNELSRRLSLWRSYQKLCSPRK